MVGTKQRNCTHVLVGQQDAKHLGLFLDLAPGGHAAGLSATALDQLAGGVRDAVGVQRILAQEHLMGGVRRIGLVLVDERSRGVDGPHVVRRAHDAVGAGGDGGAGQHHEIRRATRHIQRIVGLKRDEHGAAAALVDEIQAVIEELAEQREPRVERSRQPDVRGNVGDLDVVAVHRDAERLERRIADHARGIQIGELDGMRRRRRGQGVQRRLFRGAGSCVFVAVAELVCRSLGVLHHHAGLIFGVERGLEGVVDVLHQGDVGQVGLDEPATLQAFQDRGRIARASDRRSG